MIIDFPINSLLRQKINAFAESRAFIKPTDRIDKYKILTDDYRSRLFNSLVSKHLFYKKTLETINLDKKFANLISSKKSGLAHFEKIISLHFKTKTLSFKKKLDVSKNNMFNASVRIINSKKILIKNLNKSLIHLNPLNIIERGYAAVFSAEKKPITSVKQLKINEQINFLLKDGSADCEIKKIDLK